MRLDSMKRAVRGAGFSRLMAGQILCLSLCQTVVTSDAAAGSVTWLPDSDGAWTTPANWSSNPSLPGPGDDVTIDVAGDRSITLSGGGTQSINSLLLNEKLTLSAATTLAVGTTAQLNNTLALNGGSTLRGTYNGGSGGLLSVVNGTLDGVTANVPITASTNAFHVNGGLVLNDTLSFLGEIHFAGAGMAAGELSGSGTVTLGGTSFASFIYNDSDQSGAAGTLTIAPGMTVHGRGNILNKNAGGTILNRGTISAEVSGGMIYAGNNFTGSFINQGRLSAANGGTLYVAQLKGDIGTATVNGVGSKLYLSGTNLVNNLGLSAPPGTTLSIEGNWTNPSGSSITANSATLILAQAGAWSNAGTIAATNSTVYLDGDFAQADLGTFSRAGSTVNLRGLLRGDLTLSAATGDWNLQGGTLAGGIYSVKDGASLAIQKGTFLDMTVNSPLAVTDGSLKIYERMDLNDTLTVGKEDGSTAGTLAFGLDGDFGDTLAGTGTVVLGGNVGNTIANNAIVGTGRQLTIGKGITVRGKNGTFTGGPILNQGTIAADVAGGTIRLGYNTDTTTNEGTLKAINGGTLTISGEMHNAPGGVIMVNGSTLNLGDSNMIWSNAGSFTAINSTVNLAGSFTPADLATFSNVGSTVNQSGTLTGDLALSTATGDWNLTGGTLRNGTYGATDGKVLSMSWGTLDHVTLNAPAAVNGISGKELVITGGVVLNDTLMVGNEVGSTSGIIRLAQATLAGSGTIVLGGRTGNQLMNGLSKTTPLTIAAGFTIRGKSGHIFNSYISKGVIINQGTITADVAGGTIRIGSEDGSFINQGTLSAVNNGGLSVDGVWSNAPNATITATDSTLSLGSPSYADYPWSNAGTITATNSTVNLGGRFAQADLGTFNRSGGTVNLSGVLDGNLTLDANSGSWNLVGGRLSGVYSASAGSALTVLSSGQTYSGAGGEFIGLTVNGPVVVSNSGEPLRIYNGAVLNNTVVLGAADGSTYGRIDFGNSDYGSGYPAGTLSGSGRIAVGGDSRNVIYNFSKLAGTPGTLTIASGITVDGKSVQILNAYTSGTIFNQGTISADVPDGTITLGSSRGAFVNQGTLSAAGGTLSIQATNFTNSGTLAVDSGTLQIASSLTIPGASLHITGGVFKIGAGGAGAGSTVLRINGPLTIAGGGKIDLGNNQLIVDYDAAGASSITSVRGMLASGYAGGAWDGPGVASVGIAAGKSIGFAEAVDVLGAAGGRFAGQDVDASAILVRYTVNGDATLDGVVDFNDLVKLAQNYNTAPGEGSTWYRGDFNYDGMVDFNDLVKLAQNYNAALPGGAIPGAPANFAGDLAAAFAGVPEPTALPLLVMGWTCLARRRKARGR